jgi:hypothetical protein
LQLKLWHYSLWDLNLGPVATLDRQGVEAAQKSNKVLMTNRTEMDYEKLRKWQINTDGWKITKRLIEREIEGQWDRDKVDRRERKERERERD